jgi:hypothetical protein
VQAAKLDDEARAVEEPKTDQDEEKDADKEKPAPVLESNEATDSTPQPQPETEAPQSVEPESIPLPASGQATPSISRIASPVSANGQDRTSSLLSATHDIFSANSTPKHDRVAVSPLDPPPPAEKDYGFHHLSIGGSSQPAPPPPPKTTSGWSQPSTAATGSKFAGKGWAAVDDADDLFGPGGASSKSDPWGEDGDGEGWAGDNVPTMSGPSQVSALIIVIYVADQ